MRMEKGAHPADNCDYECDSSVISTKAVAMGVLPFPYLPLPSPPFPSHPFPCPPLP